MITRATDPRSDARRPQGAEGRGDRLGGFGVARLQAMQVIAAHPDVNLVLLDLNLPDRDGFSVLAELGERYPEIAVVVLSAQHDRDSVVQGP